MYKINKKICAKWTRVDILTKTGKLLILNMKEQSLSWSLGQPLGTAKKRSEGPTNFAARQKEGYLWATSIKR